MLKLQLSDIAMWTRGHLYGADALAQTVSIDSRCLKPGALFVAIPGEHVDGHDFLEDASRHGAVGALVSRSCEHPLPQVLVEDSVIALGDLASAVRARYPVQVLGITGSCGKTTVKTLITAILSRHAPTHASSANYNNEIGLPLSLLAAPDEARYLVLEMGAGKPGDISYLAAIARPQIALVNNVAAAHLERLETLDGVAATKGAIYEVLPADGIAVVNADDAYASVFANQAAPRRILRFGHAAAAEVRAEDIVANLQGSSFQLLTPLGSAPVSLHLPGPHNLMNALAATALALAAEVPLADIVAGLQSVGSIPGRLQVIPMPGDWTLIDDTYNANPASVMAAISLLATAPAPTWLVLGDLAELGTDAVALHAELGQCARAAGIGKLWTLGRLSRHASEIFGPGARHFESREELLEALLAALSPGLTCLIKGSRAAAMEAVVAALLERQGGAYAA